MITKKEAWEGSNPDTFGLLDARKAKKLWIACEWFSTAGGKEASGFMLRAKLLASVVQEKQDRKKMFVAWVAAIVSLVGAAASWYSALDAREGNRAVQAATTMQPTPEPKMPAQSSKSETKPKPDISTPLQPTQLPSAPQPISPKEKNP